MPAPPGASRMPRNDDVLLMTNHRELQPRLTLLLALHGSQHQLADHVSGARPAEADGLHRSGDGDVGAVAVCELQHRSARLDAFSHLTQSRLLRLLQGLPPAQPLSERSVAR